MPIRKSRPIAMRAKGLSDTSDSTNVAMGAMASLSNLIPAPQTKDNWVSRPASTLDTDFPDFSTPEDGEALFSQGTRIYGFIQSALFSGHSEPFIYDQLAEAFVAISGMAAGNTPVSTASGGDWIPPTIDQVGGYVLFTHPGFSLPNAFGWLDMTGYSDDAVTGDTHTSTTIDTFSGSALTAGWQPGMLITDSAGDLQTGTRIVSIAADGLSAIISLPAVGSNNATTFTVSGGTFDAPLWAAGNTNTNPLPAVATAVAQYAGSACYAVNTVSPPSAAVVFSDSGDPLFVTDSGTNQVVTFKSALAVTALKGLPLFTLTGGIVQSLIAFQGPNAIQQLTGAPATSNLAVNSLNDSVGTLAPNSVAATPKGLLFAAPDGIRLIDFTATISPPIGRRGAGVTLPFLFAQNPSRMAAAYNESVYRISVQNGAVQGVPTQEYWYHLDDSIWSGPHTFPAALIVATAAPHSFALFGAGIPAALWRSDAYATLSADYVENGVQMTFVWQTSLLPDTLQMSENALNETALAIALPNSQNIQVTATNESSLAVGAAQLAGPAIAPSLWGSAVWGTSLWGAGSAPYKQVEIAWPAPIVFKQMQVALTGDCAEGLELGNLYMRYEELGYLLPTS